MDAYASVSRNELWVEVSGGMQRKGRTLSVFMVARDVRCVENPGVYKSVGMKGLDRMLLTADAPFPAVQGCWQVVP